MNNLIGRFLGACVRLEPRKELDGQGGFATRWTEGREFMAAVVKKGSSRSRNAERETLGESYSVTTPPGVGLMFGDAFRRKADGAVFRVTSNNTDSRPPKGAGFDFERVTAERWEPV